MSTDASVRVGVGLGEGFKIKTLNRCRMVFGPVPISEMAMLMHGYSKKALADAEIADLIGAVLVIGEPEDLAELRKLDLPVSERRHRDYLAATEMGLHHRVAMWLRRGERGASSNAMWGLLVFSAISDGTKS